MKTIIFDFDGTIADSFELALEIAAGLTDRTRIDDAEVQRLRHMPLAKVIRELHIPITRLPRLLLDGRRLMHERISEVHTFAGIPEALKTLHEAGNHMLVISSNSEQNVRSFLRANNLEQYFDGVYGSAALFNKASALKRVIKRNRIDSDNCYYVGDEVRDVVGATKAGVTPVAVAWGYQAPEAFAEHQPFALVTNPQELVAVFGDDTV